MEVKGVVHCKKEPYDIYIGRPSKWGNPFRLDDEDARGSTLESYRNWVTSQPHLMEALGELDGKVLGCWCAPRSCHGDVLAELVSQVPY